MMTKRGEQIIINGKCGDIRKFEHFDISKTIIDSRQFTLHKLHSLHVVDSTDTKN
jgi:hypothetical protein